jgi:hypothetical protein
MELVPGVKPQTCGLLFPRQKLVEHQNKLFGKPTRFDDGI